MEKKSSKKFLIIQTSRQVSQFFFFTLFIYLLLKTQFPNGDYIGPVEIFFHFDPLLALITFLSSHIFFAAFFFSLIAIFITLIFGRVFCGWFCPLGTINHFFSFIFQKLKLKKRDKKFNLINWKYLLLIFILICSIFSLNLVGILDPLSLTFRSLTISILPSLNYAFNLFINLLAKLKLNFIADSLVQFSYHFTINSHFHQGFFIGLLFLTVILLNLSTSRFWCKYICPLGALLGLISRLNLMKIKVNNESCIECDLCSTNCSGQAQPFPNEEWKITECIYCFKCGKICPVEAIDFKFEIIPRKKSINLERRKWIFTAILGALAIPFFRIGPSNKRSSPQLIRPPGALKEEEFLKRCVKCGECMKVCPTNALQPCLSEAGVEGFWTPRFVFRIGYCEYYCTLCSQVCPTGAIKELRIEEKVKIKIGTAFIDKNRCLPYFNGINCIVCEEHCPTSPKAIKFVSIEVKLPDGSIKKPLAPVVDLDLCIGCGICEYKCPVVDKPAIYITSIGETRSEKNKLILEGKF